MTVLSVRDLRLELARENDTILPVDGVSFDVERGEVLGIAGESGAGKSLTIKALIGLLPAGARRQGEVLLDLDGRGLRSHDPAEVRGRGVSFVFQEPMAALNPTMRVGDLVAEGLRVRDGLGRGRARGRAVELLAEVGVPDPARRARMWPHQLSGGLRQRVMIAAALSTRPQLLLCDEPTTALDVSVQDQILALLLELRRRFRISVVFVSHDLAVLGEICDRVVVMYAGRIMESGPVNALFGAPRHPYTRALAESVPSFDAAAGALSTIPGRPPDPASFGDGCRFAPRCPCAQEDCLRAGHELASVAPGHATACIHPESLLARMA